MAGLGLGHSSDPATDSITSGIICRPSSTLAGYKPNLPTAAACASMATGVHGGSRAVLVVWNAFRTVVALWSEVASF